MVVLTTRIIYVATQRCFQTIILFHVLVLLLLQVLSHQQHQQRISSCPHQQITSNNNHHNQQHFITTATAFQIFQPTIFLGRPKSYNNCFSKYTKNRHHDVPNSDWLLPHVLHAHQEKRQRQRIVNNKRNTPTISSSLLSTSTTESSEDYNDKNNHNDTTTTTKSSIDTNTNTHAKQQQQQQQQQQKSTIRGDVIRESTGIRPSLHPITINAIADGLKLLVSTLSSSSTSNSPNTTLPITPTDIVQWANTIGTKTIIKRQQTSKNDGMKLTSDEQQVILGRIIGVFIRLYQLDTLLYTKCTNVSWISKYNEYDTFGIIPITTRTVKDVDKTLTSKTTDSTEPLSLLRLYIQNDIIITKICTEPLFVINKAECLLSLFIHTIEKPQLQNKNISLCDNSIIDFLDTDRQQVLLS